MRQREKERERRGEGRIWNEEARGEKAEGRQKDWLLVVAPSPSGYIWNTLPTKGSENMEKEKERW